jgi:hypothetical protein
MEATILLVQWKHTMFLNAPYFPPQGRSFLVNDQIYTHFFFIYLFQFSICFEQHRAHHQKNQLYQYNLCYMSLCVGAHRFVCRSENSFPTCTRNGHWHRVTYQKMYWYIWFSWCWARGCSKHVENWNKYIEKNFASRWSFIKNHNEMHGQQNIKERSLSHVSPMYTLGFCYGIWSFSDSPIREIFRRPVCQHSTVLAVSALYPKRHS